MSLAPATDEKTAWTGYPSVLDGHEPYDPEVISAVADGWFSAVIWARVGPPQTFFGLAIDGPRAILVQGESAFSIGSPGKFARSPFIKKAASSPLLAWVKQSHPFHDDEALEHYLLAGDETVVHIVSSSTPVLSAPLDYEDALSWARTVNAEFFESEPLQ